MALFGSNALKQGMLENLFGTSRTDDQQGVLRNAYMQELEQYCLQDIAATQHSMMNAAASGARNVGMQQSLGSAYGNMQQSPWTRMGIPPTPQATGVLIAHDGTVLSDDWRGGAITHVTSRFNEPTGQQRLEFASAWSANRVYVYMDAKASREELEKAAVFYAEVLNQRRVSGGVEEVKVSI